MAVRGPYENGCNCISSFGARIEMRFGGTGLIGALAPASAEEAFPFSPPAMIMFLNPRQKVRRLEIDTLLELQILAARWKLATALYGRLGFLEPLLQQRPCEPFDKQQIEPCNTQPETKLRPQWRVLEQCSIKECALRKEM